MPDNFQQTVNLKEQMEKMKAAKAQSPRQPAASKPVRPEPAKTKAEDIDRLYRSGGTGENKKEDLKNFNHPAAQPKNRQWQKYALFALAIAIIAVSLYFIAIRNKDIKQAEQVPVQDKWYKIELVNGKIYYGQISDTKADPVEVKNVYYPYDQPQGAAGDASKTDTSGNLRLVKYGKETYGPEGTMNVIRAQVITMDPLKDDSKVLKAILDYEKK